MENSKLFPSDPSVGAAAAIPVLPKPADPLSVLRLTFLGTIDASMSMTRSSTDHGSFMVVFDHKRMGCGFGVVSSWRSCDSGAGL